MLECSCSCACCNIGKIYTHTNTHTCCNVVAVVVELYAVHIALMADENAQRVVLVHAPDARCRMYYELKASYTSSLRPHILVA